MQTYECTISPLFETCHCPVPFWFSMTHLEILEKGLTSFCYIYQAVERATWQRFYVILRLKMAVMPLEFIPWMITSWLRLKRFVWLSCTYLLSIMEFVSFWEFFYFIPTTPGDIINWICRLTILSFLQVEDNEFSKTSANVRGKKAVVKKVIEYCYEPEMEDVSQIIFLSFKIFLTS